MTFDFSSYNPKFHPLSFFLCTTKPSKYTFPFLLNFPPLFSFSLLEAITLVQLTFHFLPCSQGLTH